MGETMQAVVIGADGGLSLGAVARPEIGPNDVLVEVRASGLNRADLLQRRGMYPPPPGASDIMGLECAGVIVELGAEVNGWAVGDRVCALLAGGGYAQYAAVDAGSLLPLPNQLDFTQGACLAEAMMTVWANVYDRCRFQTGEAFLVHGGTSGIGVMAIQMAKAHGASAIYATAGTDEKCALCEQLGADIAINYREADFEAIIRDAGGVDVILDMVGGEYVAKNISIAREDGRIVNIAYQAGLKVEVNFLPVMLKRLVLTATTLRARPVAEKARLREGVQSAFWPALERGEITPVIDSVHKAAAADAAQKRMSDGAHSGKIVLDWT